MDYLMIMRVGDVSLALGAGLLQASQIRGRERAMQSRLTLRQAANEGCANCGKPTESREDHMCQRQITNRDTPPSPTPKITYANTTASPPPAPPR
jgi:hypothetical protein